MFARIALAAILVSATPAFAADLATSHEEVKVAPGKLHARAYRPLAQNSCATPKTGHPSGGKMLSGPPIPFHDANCAKQQAAAKAKQARG